MNRSLIFLIGCGFWLAACTGETSAPPTVEEAPADHAAASVLTFDTTGRAVYATNQETGARALLFEDEGAPEEQGTWHRLLSSFGPYASYRSEWYYEGGAHPSYGTRYVAVALRDSLRPADLRELFPDDALLAALHRDSLVQAAGLEAATLDGLLDALARHYGCVMDVDGFSTSFFVRNVTGDSATVVVGLTHGCEVERGSFTPIELGLTIPPASNKLFGDLRLYADLEDE